MPSFRLVLSNGMGGIGAVASGIGGVISLGDWIELPVYDCGASGAVVTVCGRMQSQLNFTGELFLVGLVLMTSALFVSPERGRLSFVLVEMLVIVAILMLALWFVGGTFSVPFR